MHFGIGADNLLIIQPTNKKTLQEINRSRNYWDELPDILNCDLIFRMLEPDGQEALCCANGLLCIALYLFKLYNLNFVRILSGIPNKIPNKLKIGTEINTLTSWVQFDSNSKVDMNYLTANKASNAFYLQPDQIELSVSFDRSSDPVLLTQLSPFVLRGFYVKFGEPHLVIFSHDNNFSEKFIELIFPVNPLNKRQKVKNRNLNYEPNIIHSLGLYLNTNFQNLFPEGINIDFVNSQILVQNKRVEYRTFERGILKETFACGTGALAIALAAFSLGLIDPREIIVKPFLIRQNNYTQDMCIRKNKDSYFFYGKPDILFQGYYQFADLPKES
jgi:diaminopimelate epimerase